MADFDAALSIPAFLAEGEFSNPSFVGSVTAPAFTADAEAVFGSAYSADVSSPAFVASATMYAGTILRGAVRAPAFQVLAYGPSYGAVEYSFEVSGTLISGAVLSGAVTPRAFTAAGSLVSAEMLSASVTIPMPRVSGTLVGTAMLSAAVSAPRFYASGSHLGGSSWSAALEVPFFSTAGQEYNAYVHTAALIAPRFRVNGTLVSSIGAEYRTWVVNTRKKAMTEYDYDFNSYAKFRGVLLSANATGIYAHAGENSDAGEDIPARVRTGKDNFGTTFNKRVPRIYVSAKADGDLKFKTILSLSGERTYLLQHNGATEIQTRRVPVGKGPKSAQWQFELQNIDGADFTLENMQVYPTKTERRVV